MSDDIENNGVTAKEAEQPNTEKRNYFVIALSIVGWIVTICLIICAAISVFFRLQTKVKVDGTSMEPTLFNGDVLCLDTKVEAERGDIVVINVSDNNLFFPNGYIIKRVIAVAGDKVRCEKNQVYVCYAGETEYTPLEESYLADDMWTSSFFAVTVGEGQVFVLGDNRIVSLDSRKAGCFSTEDVVGVVPDWSYAIKGIATTWYDITSAIFPKDTNKTTNF